MTIEPVLPESEIWNLLMTFADHCSWSAGPLLAKCMREGMFQEWERVFVAREGLNIAGYCTLAKTDYIPDVTYTPYIGFVFVGESFRGKRLSQQLIRCALDYARHLGFAQVFLVSAERGLYEKYGFIKIDNRKDQWGMDEQIFVIST